MPGDERLINFHNCPSGIAANIHWLRDQHIPVASDVNDWTSMTGLYCQPVGSLSTLLIVSHSHWRPTLDAPLDRETQARLRKIMAQHQAINAAELDVLWDQRGNLTLVRGQCIASHRLATDGSSTSTTITGTISPSAYKGSRSTTRVLPTVIYRHDTLGSSKALVGPTLRLAMGGNYRVIVPYLWAR